jgi:hypothetical protein
MNLYVPQSVHKVNFANFHKLLELFEQQNMFLIPRFKEKSSLPLKQYIL